MLCYTKMKEKNILYKDKKFKVRPLEDVLADFDAAAMLYGGHIRRLFLAVGGAQIGKTDTDLYSLAYTR